MTIGIAVCSLLIGLALLVGYTAQHTQGKNGKAEAQSLRGRVGKLVILPANEEPTIATITDRTKVSDKFLQQAENGDKLLLYYKSLKVYIYRPSVNKVVDIGPITVDPSAYQAKGARIVVRDGSGTPGKAATIRDRLRTSYKDAVVSEDIESAARSDYPNTIAIDITDGSTKYDLVTNVISAMGIQRGVLPLGETSPDNIDVLVIVGRN